MALQAIGPLVIAPNAGDGSFDLLLEAPNQLTIAGNRFLLGVNLGHSRLLASKAFGDWDWNPIQGLLI